MSSKLHTIEEMVRYLRYGVLGPPQNPNIWHSIAVIADLTGLKMSAVKIILREED